MAIQPLGDRVLVRPVEAKEEMKGGLYIPDTAKEKPQEGTIVELGTGKVADNGEKVPFEVQKGDRVLYGKYSGTEVAAEEEKYLMMRESEILAVIKG